MPNTNSSPQTSTTSPTQPAAYQPPTPVFKEKWVIALVAFFALSVVVSFLLSVFTPKQAPANQQRAWDNIAPGVTKKNELEKKLGAPIGETTLSWGGTQYEYESSYKGLNHQAIVDQNNVVQFVKEEVPVEENTYLKDYTDKFGQPDLELYPPTNLPVKAYVFLQQGLVVFGHMADQRIETRWYFAPTTEELFLQSWGEELSTQSQDPEFLEP